MRPAPPEPVLDERDRIARDLHDHVIQRLFAVGLAMQSVAGDVDGGPGRKLRFAVDEIDATIAQIRATIYRLATPALRGERSLRGQASQLVDDLDPVLGFRPELSIEGPVDLGLDDELAADCLAVLREALSNVARHAGARRAAVALRLADSRLVVEVCDDGRGVGRTSRHSGLRNLRARARARGGTLTVTSAGSGGTRLRWSVPVAGRPGLAQERPTG